MSDPPSKETLTRLYWDEKLSQSEIGERLGVTRPRVSQMMTDADIPTRTVSEAVALKHPTLRDKTALKRLAETHTQTEIAEHLGVSQPTVSYWFAQHGFTTHRTPPSADDLLEWVTTFTNATGTPPTHQDAANWPKVSVDDFRIHFGSVDEAVRIATTTRDTPTHETPADD